MKTNSKGGWIVTEYETIPHHSVIPDYSELGDGCTLGDRCTLGDGCKIGNGCTLGDECKIGSGCKLGDGCTLGDECKIGDRCTLENLKAVKWCTLGNVDGSGRQILIVWDGTQTKVRAGCFLGTVEAFAEKAASEGKHLYAKMIPAVANILSGKN